MVYLLNTRTEPRIFHFSYMLSLEHIFKYICSGLGETGQSE